MSSVLVVDDRVDLGEKTVEALRNAGFLAELVAREYSGEFYDAIRLGYFGQEEREALGVEAWDALVMDINWHTDKWGGIWLYNKLAKYHRECWNHTVIYTKYAGTRLPVANEDEGELFKLRIFVDSAGIPYDCVLDNVSGGRPKLVRKLEELGLKPQGGAHGGHPGQPGP